MSETISQNVLRNCVGEWLAAGKTVAGPKQVAWNRVLYAQLEKPEDLLLDLEERPVNSIKEFFFPKHEKLYGYKIEGNDVRLIETAEAAPQQVIIGGRACDAAALPILDRVFNWDYKDSQYNARRAATTIVTIACTTHDDACFCTSVGLAPAAERGSDALLLPFGDGNYEVRCLTEKGKALFAGKTKIRPKWRRSTPGRKRRSMPPRWALLRATTSKIRFGQNKRWPALVAASAHTIARRAIASTSWTRATRWAVIARATGIHASIRYSRCTPAGTIRAARSPAGSGSASTTSSISIPKSSAKRYAQGAATARATVPPGWAY